MPYQRLVCSLIRGLSAVSTAPSTPHHTITIPLSANMIARSFISTLKFLFFAMVLAGFPLLFLGFRARFSMLIKGGSPDKRFIRRGVIPGQTKK